ncbi:colicin-like pore-forming protein [Rahnella contaminans]|uniref:colicin-like pore-forming protein n=1 Tax=Rahnella contaminans TaxID=2703882 RepID=UPI0023D9C1AC|nr:colicin-like pore-forming protein [Rahnella contaminans]MDF1897298.1 colicin-like pore-forming protein [Rahnella contaminans]
MAQQLDYVIDVPVDTLIVSADPSQPAVWTNTSGINTAVQQSAYPASNAMIEYFQRNAGDIFVSEMNMGFQADTRRLLNANGKVSQAQSALTDATAAYEQAQNNGTPQQIAQAKLNFLNAQSALYQARNEMRQVTSEMMSQQILYNNGLIGFNIVPEGETPDTLNNKSAGYQMEINQMQQTTSQETEYINQVNANINQTTADQQAINSGAVPDGYKNNQQLALESAMGQITQSGEKISQHAGEKAGELAKRLASNVRGDRISNYNDAMAMFDKIKNQPKVKLNQTDRNAISAAFEAADIQSLSNNLDALGKTFGFIDKGFTTKSLYDNAKIGYVTGDWEPLMLQTESLVISGIAGAFAYSFTTSVLMGTAAALGATLPVTAAVIVAALAAGVVAAYFDTDFVKELNDSLIPSLY